ncbi:MAG: IS66 family transposase, partial [Chlamydiia bacterium]|nr:IS66 family transposase [Chlamydiia bacterium]
MGYEQLQKITITRDQIRRIYDEGPEAVESLVLSLVKSINNLTDIVNEQGKRISDLEDTINKNSRNSHKPSSTDSPYKDKGKKKSTSQKPRKKRKGTTLKQMPNPDKIVKSKVCLCEHCQADISETPSSGVDKRQVTDIPPIQSFTTEYQGEIKECPHCNKKTTALFPSGVTHKAQYGNNIQAMAVYLRNYQLIPLNRTIQLFNDLFKVSISEGSIVNMTSRCATRLSGFMEIVKDQLQKADIIHNDETGINIAGKLHWLHTAGNKNWTYLMPHKKRGGEAIDEMDILTEFKGVSVHDFWKPYEKYKCSHAYCNAHILRELIFIFERKSQAWAGDMIALLLEIKKRVDDSKTKSLNNKDSQLYLDKYNKIIKAGYDKNPLPEVTKKRGRPKKGKVLSLVLRMDNYSSDILRFMSDSNTPFDNNLGERDLRMVKVREKISGTFRNIDRVHDYCKIRSFISTVQKQKKDVFNSLLESFSPNYQ